MVVVWTSKLKYVKEENQMSDVEGNVVEHKGQPEPPLLRRAAIVRRFDALFRAMSTDFLLREQFVTDPAQIAAEYVYGTRIGAQRSSIINQLLYAVMANRGLFNWLRSYSIKHDLQFPARSKFAEDFSRAVAEHGGGYVVIALIRGSAETEPAIGFSGSAFSTAFAAFGCAGPFQYVRGRPWITVPQGPTTETGTQQSTGTATTEQSTGTAITEHSTGTETGTEQSTGTGTGTEQSTGTGTGTEQSTGTGTGTEQSTGTGTATEQSVGTSTGTEQSTGTESTGTDGTGTDAMGI